MFTVVAQLYKIAFHKVSIMYPHDQVLIIDILFITWQHLEKYVENLEKCHETEVAAELEKQRLTKSELDHISGQSHSMRQEIEVSMIGMKASKYDRGEDIKVACISLRLFFILECQSRMHIGSLVVIVMCY